MSTEQENTISQKTLKKKNARNVFELFFFDKNKKARHQSLFSDVSTSVTLLNLTYCAQYLVLVCLPLCYYRKVEYPLHPPSFLNFHLRQLSPLRNQPLHKMSFCLYQCLYVFKRRFFFREGNRCFPRHPPRLQSCYQKIAVGSVASLGPFNRFQPRFRLQILVWHQLSRSSKSPDRGNQCRR